MSKSVGRFLPCLMVLIYLAYAVFSQLSSFTLRYPLESYESMYQTSQYVMGEASPRPIGDGDLYVFAGLRYLAGEDPTKINFEHPPFGKALFGLSYLIFGYPNSILIPLFFLCCYCFWQLSIYLIKSPLWQYVSLALFFSHTTLTKELGRTMLDFPQTAFLVITTYLYVKVVQKPSFKLGVLLGLSAGLLLSIKYPFPLIVLYLTLLLIHSCLFYRKTAARPLLFSLLVATGVYLTTYARFFTHSPSLVDFIKFEWWRLHWFMGKTQNPRFLLLSVIFLGRYPQWWNDSGNVVTFPHWNVFWPLSFMVFLFSLTDRHLPPNHPLFPYKAWTLGGLIISLLGVYEDRFLLPFIPAFALFGAHWLSSVTRIKPH